MYRRHVLKNGIRIISERVPHVRSISIGFWVGVGGRDEELCNSGVSHFVEHMCFKGTTTRSARDIAEAIDGVGGQIDAFTTKEYTCYYTRILDKHLSLGIELLGDMLFNSKLDPEDIEREKGVILEEINMYEDSPDDQIHDLFMTALWEGDPLSANILGTSDTVKGMTRETLLQHIHRYYVPENIVIAAAGNVDHEELVKLCERFLEKKVRKRNENTRRIATPCPQIIVKSKPTEQIHILLGVPGLSRNDPAKYCLGVLDNITGGGMSSRLFQRLREDRGLVYNAYSYISMFHDTGYFAIYVGTSFDKAKEVIEIIKEELKSLHVNGVTNLEFKRAKEQLKGTLILNLESTTNRMSRLGLIETFQEELHTPDDIIHKIDSITKDEVLHLSKQLLKENSLAAAVIGSNEKGDEVKRWIE